MLENTRYGDALPLGISRKEISDLQIGRIYSYPLDDMTVPGKD